MIAAAVGMGSDLDQRVAEREAELDVERGVERPPVVEDGPQAGNGTALAMIVMPMFVMMAQA
jgi:hypothetical protein